MNFELQPTLRNELVEIRPLRSEDLEPLFKIASDPLLWEQHPNRDRYKREVFEKFFEGAMSSGGAFLVSDCATEETIGSSRYYDWDSGKTTIAIGYTFVARHCWGKGFNPALKRLMLKHAFRFAEKVHFHIGASNIRSQKAIEKLGAKKIGEVEMEYYCETSKLNFIYEIQKVNWN